MSTSIGGVDLVWTVPRPGFQRAVFLDVLLQQWPRAVYQDANEETFTSVESLGARLEEEPLPEVWSFFVYESEQAARSWNEEGWSPENTNRMLHFIVQGVPEPDTLQVTMVVDALDDSMLELYYLLKLSTELSTSRWFDFGRALEAVQSPLSQSEFLRIVNEVRRALYPRWQLEELICSPHDATQFCTAVRKRIGADLPDRIIVKAIYYRTMIARRKSK